MIVDPWVATLTQSTISLYTHENNVSAGHCLDSILDFIQYTVYINILAGEPCSLTG